MPYEDTQDLPDPIREALTDDQQETFLEVVGEALNRGDSESKAHRIAWAVVQDERDDRKPPVENVDVADTDISELPEEAADLRRIMRDAERQAVKRVRQIAIDHKRAFKRRIRDRGPLTAEQLRTLGQALKEKYRPRYKRAVRELANQIRHESAKATIEHNDLEGIVSAADLPTASIDNAQFEDSLEIVLDRVVDELLQRQQGHMEDQQAEVERQTADDGDQQRKQIERLQDETLKSVLSKVSGPSMNEGRDDAAEQAREEAESEGKKVHKIRNSVLDENTCDPCERLHGKRVEAGSKKEALFQPPAFCEGKSRCRCFYDIELPDSILENDEHAPDITIKLAERHDELAPTGDHEEWIRIFSWGPVDHPQGQFEVDGEFADKMLASFKFMDRQHDYQPPIDQKHKDEGLRYGEIRDLATLSDGIYALAHWVPTAHELRQQGMINAVSPSFRETFEDPHTGKQLENWLREVSFVTHPHLKNIGTLDQSAIELSDTYYDLTEESMADQTTADNDQPATDEGAGDDEPTDLEDSPADMGDDAEMMGGDDDRDMGGEGYEMNTGGGFSDLLGKLLDKVSMPEEAQSRLPDDMQGPTRQRLLERLADGTDMNPGDLDEAIKSGALAYPPDALVESTAETFGLSVADIRKGDIGVGGDDKPEGGEMPDEKVESATDSGDMPGGVMRDEVESGEQADSDTVRELQEAKAKLTKYECERAGITDNDQIRRLCEVRRRDEEAYETALDVAASAGGSSGGDGDDEATELEDDEQPIDRLLGESGTQATGGQLRELCERAKDEGVDPGRELVSFLTDEGVPHENIDDTVIQDVYA